MVKTTFSDLIEFQYLYQTGNVPSGVIIDTYEIKYRSDGNMITGYIHKPKDNKKYPAIVYNRGGNRDFGTIDQGQLENHRNLAAHGYIVLASQLRGNIFSQGRDEFGGKDLNDILQIIKIAKTLPFVKDQMVGLHGVSRGGMNAYQISRMSDEIKSVSVVGASVDIRDSHSYRPEKYTKVHQPIIGDSIKYKAEYDKRSACLWAKEINEPLLILHGKDDPRNKVQYIEKMIVELEKHSNHFEHHFFKNGNHGLSSHADQRDSLIADWHGKFLN